jgi:hypothetical protein
MAKATIDRRRAPLCEKHEAGSGSRSGCPYCGLIELHHALSRIDYLCEQPNEMECSAYDVDYDAQRVVRAVESALKRKA